MTAPLLTWCHFCKLQLDEDTNVVIGFKRSGADPGWTWHACGPCVVAYRVIPLADHMSDTDGGIRFRDHAPHAPTAGGERGPGPASSRGSAR